MPDLDWDEQEFLECIAVLPQVEEYETEHLYQLTEAGLSLTLTLWKYESAVEIALTMSETGQPVTTQTFLARGRVHCRQEKGRTSLIFPDCVIVPSRFYLAHEWSFAETHPGMDVALQIFPQISVTTAKSERRSHPGIPASPGNLPKQPSGAKRWRTACAVGLVLAIIEFALLSIYGRFVRDRTFDGGAFLCVIVAGAFFYFLLDRRSGKD